MTAAELEARLAAVPLTAPESAVAHLAPSRPSVALAAVPSRPLDEIIGVALAHASTLRARTPAGEREQRKAAARRILERLPAFVRDKRLSQWIRDDRLGESAAAWRWGGPSMIFLGKTGIGKSSAAAALMVRLLVQGWREGERAWEAAQWLQWFSAEDLGRARREHPLGRGDAPELYEAEGASLLVIDDAGWDREPDCVSSVLAKRYERGLPTIVTSGKTLTELSAHYGAAVVRRVVDSGGRRAKLVDCFAPREGATP